MYKNKSEIEYLSYTSKADIIAIQETWERDIEPIGVPGMQLVANMKRSKQKGVGTAILTAPHITATEIAEIKYIKEKELEICGALISRDRKKNLAIINVYKGFINC